MRVDVEVERVIPFPPEDVAAFAGDPTNAPEWYANIHSVSWRTPPPTAVSLPTVTSGTAGSSLSSPGGGW